METEEDENQAPIKSIGLSGGQPNAVYRRNQLPKLVSSREIRLVSLESTEPARLHSFGWSAERKFLTADRSSDRTD